MEQCKVTIKGLGRSVQARLENAPKNANFSFALKSTVTKDIVFSDVDTNSPVWMTPEIINSGTYFVECTVATDNIIFTRCSREFDFGINKQASRPRGVVARAKHQPAPSFHSLLYWESRKAFANREHSAWLLDHKLNAYKFADKLGLKTPAMELDPFPFSTIPIEVNTVIKPLNGVMSQGVYLIMEDGIIDLVNNHHITGPEGLRKSMSGLLLSGKIKEDLWIREQLIRDDKDPESPARDIKFYTFYGQPILALETARIPKIQRCWYDNYSNLVNTGKYVTELFVGHGIPAEFYAIAEKIGLNIPAPFVRVDLLASPEGAIVNEVTPKPGGAHLFAQSIDQQLGNHLVNADGRLRADLISGKSFDIFNSLKAS